MYPAYLKRFQGAHKQIARSPFSEQMKTLFYDSFAQSDSYSTYLSKRGYECLEIVANAAITQKTWCLENDVEWNPSNYLSKVPIEVACRFRPDIVWLNDFTIFDRHWVKRLRAECPSIKLVVGFCGISVDSYDCLSGYDIVLTPVQYLAGKMREAGLRVELLRHAFDPRVLDRLGALGPKSLAVTFAGSVVRSNGFHESRARLLERLSQKFDVSIFSSSASDRLLKKSARSLGYGVCSFLRRLGQSDESIKQLPFVGRYISLNSRPSLAPEHPVWSRVKQPVYGLKMYRTLAQSGMTLNTHAECAGNSAGNIRLFEATGVGTCVITDSKDDLHELFEVGAEVIAYSSVEECVEKIAWLLDHPLEVDDIGLAGMRRTLRDHTYDCRAELLDGLFRQNC